MADIYGRRTDAQAMRELLHLAIAYGMDDGRTRYENGEDAVLAAIPNNEYEIEGSIFATLRRSAHVSRGYRMTGTDADAVTANAWSDMSMSAIAHHIGKLHIKQTAEMAHALEFRDPITIPDFYEV